MAEIYKLKLRDDQGVQEALEDAIARGFDEVVIVGIKGTELFTSKSANASTITWLGCLEYLRSFLYNRMAGFE